LIITFMLEPAKLQMTEPTRAAAALAGALSADARPRQSLPSRPPWAHSQAAVVGALSAYPARRAPMLPAPTDRQQAAVQ